MLEREKGEIYRIYVESTHFLTEYKRPLLAVLGFTAVALVVGLSAGSISGALIERATDHHAFESSKGIVRALNDPTNLEPGQKFYEKVMIVGAGYNIEIKVHMDQTKPHIGVTNGIGGRTIAKVRVGNAAYDVLVQDETAATWCGNIEGLEPINEGGLPPANGELCAFNWVFAQRTS